MKNDPVLDEIRRVRHAISQKIGHDARRIVSYYAELQRQHKGRIVDLSNDAATRKESAPDFLRREAALGSRADFERVLAKVPNVPPEPYDSLE